MVWGVPNLQLGELVFSVARHIASGEIGARNALDADRTGVGHAGDIIT